MNKKILELVCCGFDITLGRVSIVNIPGQIHRIQVFSDDYRFKCNEMYKEYDMEAAVDKFVLCINQIRKKNDKSTKEKVKSM